MLLIRLVIRAPSVRGAFVLLTDHPQAEFPYTDLGANSLSEGTSEGFFEFSATDFCPGDSWSVFAMPKSLDHIRFNTKPFRHDSG